MTRLVVIVGEASGDILAAGLVRSLRARLPNLEVVGVTGPRLRAEGCESWADYEQLAVMGMFEVLKHLPQLLKLSKQIEKRLEADPPDMVIGVDAPDFNLRLLKRARAQGIPTVQYVCPSVWAWRTWRVKKIAAACDHVLCLLPFEKGFLEAHEIAATFVGHPLADEIEPAGEIDGVAGAGSGPVVAVLPGSRMTEIHYVGPICIATMQWLVKELPDISFVTAAANAKTGRAFNQLVVAAGLEQLVKQESAGARVAMRNADSILLASGTATLEAMLLGKPMVVTYKLSPLTAWLLRILGTVKIDRFALPNLLADEMLVPEYMQEQAQAHEIGAAVRAQLTDQALRATLRERLLTLGNSLRRSASDIAAETVAELLQQRAGD